MKYFLPSLVFATIFLSACSKQNEVNSVLPTEETVSIVQETLPLTSDQVRSIVRDEIAKVKGDIQLDMMSYGIPTVIPVFDTTIDIPGVVFDAVNSRYYWEQIVKLKDILSEDVDGSAVLEGTHKIRYEGVDYAIVVKGPSYSLALEHNVTTFMVSMYEHGKSAESFSMSIDEKTTVNNPDPVYVGSVHYRLFDEDGSSSTVSDYGVCAARLTELIDKVPVILKAGKLMEV
jgi:hypothetical protein